MELEKVDVSVIIPAYNAAGFLERAVDSVRVQHGLTWEIILVENGSADNTYEFCGKLAEQDERIHVFQSEKGVSRARNRGIAEARGTWICFLDADDYLYAHAFEYLQQMLNGECSNQKTDLILFGHNSDAENLSGDSIVYEGAADCLNLCCSVLENPTKDMPVWGKLFASKQMREWAVLFDEELQLAEDADFSYRFMRRCSRICRTEAQLYHYTKDIGSAVRTYREGKAQKYLNALEKMKRCVDVDGTEIRSAFDIFVAVHLLLILVHDTFAKENPHSEEEKRSEMRGLLKQELFRDSIRRIPLKKCKTLRMLPILFLKCRMNFAAVWLVKLRIWKNGRGKAVTV